jgi:DNA polymerase III epsilon subunit family exonuclease
MLLRSSGRDKYRLVWFDLETTGFNPFKDEIIELACLDNEGGVYESLIKPVKRIRPKITEITSITNEMVEDQRPCVDILREFVEFIKGDVSETRSIYLIGHNIHSFDMPFVKAKCAEFNIKFPNVYLIDTMRMSQYILDEYSHNLAHLCQLFGIDNQNAHRALSDVYATQVVYCNLCHFFKRAGIKDSPNRIYNATSVLFK